MTVLLAARVVFRVTAMVGFVQAVGAASGANAVLATPQPATLPPPDDVAGAGSQLERANGQPRAPPESGGVVTLRELGRSPPFNAWFSCSTGWYKYGYGTAIFAVLPVAVPQAQVAAACAKLGSTPVAGLESYMLGETAYQCSVGPCYIGMTRRSASSTTWRWPSGRIVEFDNRQQVNYDDAPNGLCMVVKARRLTAADCATMPPLRPICQAWGAGAQPCAVGGALVANGSACVVSVQTVAGKPQQAGEADSICALGATVPGTAALQVTDAGTAEAAATVVAAAGRGPAVVGLTRVAPGSRAWAWGGKFLLSASDGVSWADGHPEEAAAAATLTPDGRLTSVAASASVIPGGVLCRCPPAVVPYTTPTPSLPPIPPPGHPAAPPVPAPAAPPAALAAAALAALASAAAIAFLLVTGRVRGSASGCNRRRRGPGGCRTGCCHGCRNGCLGDAQPRAAPVDVGADVEVSDLGLTGAAPYAAAPAAPGGGFEPPSALYGSLGGLGTQRRVGSPATSSQSWGQGATARDVIAPVSYGAEEEADGSDEGEVGGGYAAPGLGAPSLPGGDDGVAASSFPL